MEKLKYLFYLNGAYEDIARAEICSLLGAYGYQHSVSGQHPQTLLLSVSGTVDPSVFSRLALSHRVMAHIGSIEPGSGVLCPTDYAESISRKSFSVRVKKISKGISAMDEERRIATCILDGAEHASVDLGSPEKEVYCLYTGEMLHCGITIFKSNPKEFNERKPQHRPYFHPSSLDPRLARALVNLSGARKEVLDPFCGTGGILIEAGLMGLNAFGIDIEPKMVEGTKRNTLHYGIDATTVLGDATRLSEIIGGIETIVTDVPYGKSTVVEGSRSEMYSRAFVEMSRIVRKKLVIVVPAELDFSEFGLVEEQSFSIRVHKSLMRHIYVLVSQRV